MFYVPLLKYQGSHMNGRVGQSTTSLTASNLVSQKWVEMVGPADCGYSTVGTRAVVGLCLTPAAYTHYIHPLTPFSSGKHQSGLSIYESGYVLFVSSFVLLFRPHIKVKSYSIFLVWFISLPAASHCVPSSLWVISIYNDVLSVSWFTVCCLTCWL